MKAPSVSRLVSGNLGAPSRFRIRWQGNVKTWLFHSPENFAPAAVLGGIVEVINRNQGRAFLLPSLSRACGFEVAPGQVAPDITVLKFQEGSDTGVYKVTARVSIPDQGQKEVSFCLNAAKSARANALLTDVHRDLQELRSIDDRFVVAPYLLETAATKTGRVVVHSTEWLDDYTEVNMFNLGEDMPGVEAVGLSRAILNRPGSRSFEDMLIKDHDIEAAIVDEMVRIQVRYFDRTAGRSLRPPSINAGDFVCKIDPDGTPHLKLITTRGFVTDHPTVPKGENSLNVVGFIGLLINHRENSVKHQFGGDEAAARQYALYTYTASNVCRGVKKALIEEYGEEGSRLPLLQWLATYLNMNGMLRQMQGYRDKNEMLRDMLASREIEQFLRGEGYEPGTVRIEL